MCVFFFFSHSLFLSPILARIYSSFSFLSPFSTFFIPTFLLNYLYSLSCFLSFPFRCPAILLVLPYICSLSSSPSFSSVSSSLFSYILIPYPPRPSFSFPPKWTLPTPFSFFLSFLLYLLITSSLSPLHLVSRSTHNTICNKSFLLLNHPRGPIFQGYKLDLSDSLLQQDGFIECFRGVLVCASETSLPRPILTLGTIFHFFF